MVATMAADVENASSGAAYRVTLRFDDGVEKIIAAAPGEFVLDAALRQGVPLVHQCRSGSCSTCVAQIVQGDIAMAPGRSTSLIATEAAEGKRLLCSAYALRDSLVRLHYPAGLIYENSRRVFAAHVSNLDWPAPTVAKLTLELDAAGDFTFRSGQYVRVRVPDTNEWRSYSMASMPRDLPQLEFLVRLIDGGTMSEYLRAPNRVGEAITIEGPLGAFILHPSRAPHIFVAGGTGLAPIISMLDEIRRRSGPRPKMLLSYGCASERQFFYRDEIELRAWWMPELRVILSADQVDVRGSGLICGTPVAALGEDRIVDRGTRAYLCGPPPMIVAARRRLAALGVKPDHIYAEQFVPSSIG
jgi:benzoate/toluate 1,2-dioxygenase reductase subunit